MLLVALAACNGGDTDTDAAIAGPIRSCDVQVTATAPAGVTTVEIAGTFGDWEPLAMADDDGDGVFTLSLGELRPGTYAYKYVFDGIWEEVPPDVYTAWDGGVENRALVVEDCEQPALTTVRGAAGTDRVEAVFRFERGADGARLAAPSVQVSVGGAAAEWRFDEATGELEVWKGGLGPGKHSVRVSVADTAGRAAPMAYLPLWIEAEPFAWSSGLLYYAFLDRFADGGDDGLGPILGPDAVGRDYLGGDLVGATAQLEAGYFDELGVRSVWLSPLPQNPDTAWIGSDGVNLYTGYHGYWPTRAREVEDRLGTVEVPADEALRSFVEAAHARGIRVVIDVVLNHVHQDHEYLTSNPDWFTAAPCACTSEPGACNWDTNPIGCWFTGYLPDLDYRNPEIVAQSVEDLRWWIETYDIDGLRIDAAKHMDHVILRTTSMQIHDRYEAPVTTADGDPAPGRNDFWLVGETFVGQGGQGLIMDYVAPYELDGQFDFPLMYPIRSGIGGGGGFRGLAAEVRASDAAYGDSVHQMSPFLGNHDVSRYATDVQGCPTWALYGGCPDVLATDGETAISDPAWDVVNKLSVSWAFVATQPGVPLLYYGDEIGLAGAGDPDNRRPMSFDGLSLAQRTLRDRFGALGRLRADSTALQRGARVELWVDDDLYVFARDAGAGDVAIVALRLGGAARTQAVPIPTRLALEGRTLTDALGGPRQVTVTGGSATITLDPWEYVVLSPSD